MVPDFAVTVFHWLINHIDWTSVCTTAINTSMYLSIPFVIEITTGVLKSTTTYLEAHKDNSWALRLMSDVATTMNAQWQLKAKDLRAKWDAGQLTSEEWKQAQEELKSDFKSKMQTKLQAYPAAYVDKFAPHIEEHMESWLAHNKQIEELTKTIKANTAINDPDIIKKLTEFANSQAGANK